MLASTLSSSHSVRALHSDLFRAFAYIHVCGSIVFSFFEAPFSRCVITGVVIALQGGGGMISGMAVALKALDPRIKIFGAEPANAADAADVRGRHFVFFFLAPCHCHVKPACHQAV